MMSFRYSELFLLVPGLSVVITILLIVFILIRLCRMHYCEGVEIQRHRDTMIYSREDARYFDICRVADRMDVSNDDSLTTVENDSLILRKQNCTPITHQQTNYPNDESQNNTLCVM